MTFIAVKTNGTGTVRNIGFFDNVIDTCVQLSGGSNIVRGNFVEEGSVFADVQSDGNTIESNIAPAKAIVLTGSDRNIVRGNQTGRIALSDSHLNQIGGNRSYLSPTHGIELSASNDNLISGNIVDSASVTTDNTSDGISVDGHKNLVTGNMVRYAAAGNQTRYGINIAGGDCNKVVGNDLTDSGQTAPLSDSGTNTQLFWPADVTYGDNFVYCGVGS